MQKCLARLICLAICVILGLGGVAQGEEATKQEILDQYAAMHKLWARLREGTQDTDAAYAALGEYREAVEAICELYPENGYILLDLNYLYFIAKRYDEAEQMLTRAAKCNVPAIQMLVCGIREYNALWMGDDVLTYQYAEEYMRMYRDIPAAAERTQAIFGAYEVMPYTREYLNDALDQNMAMILDDHARIAYELGQYDECLSDTKEFLAYEAFTKLRFLTESILRRQMAGSYAMLCEACEKYRQLERQVADGEGTIEPPLPDDVVSFMQYMAECVLSEEQ